MGILVTLCLPGWGILVTTCGMWQTSWLPFLCLWQTSWLLSVCGGVSWYLSVWVGVSVATCVGVTGILVTISGGGHLGNHLSGWGISTTARTYHGPKQTVHKEAVHKEVVDNTSHSHTTYLHLTFATTKFCSLRNDLSPDEITKTDHTFTSATPKKNKNGDELYWKERGGTEDTHYQ